MAVFTLLELAIAMALLAVIVTLLLIATNSVSSTWVKLLTEQTAFRETLTVERTLDRVLTNAVPFIWRDEEGEEKPVFYGERSRMRIAYQHRVKNTEEGGVKFVRLAVTDNQELVADYQSRPFLEASLAGPNLKRSVLAEGVESIEFFYADWAPDDGLFWREEWDPDMSDPLRDELPIAIGVNVTWEDGRREAWLRRTSGNSAFERYGSWEQASPGDRP